MAEAVGQTFEYWTRYFRVFSAPSLLERIDREEIRKWCWKVLEDRYLEPTLDMD